RSRPDSQPNPKPEKNRLDVSGPAAGPNPTGIITFTNAGPGSANGLLSSDSPWIIFPTDASFSLEPGESRVANFTVDTAQQATAGSSSNTGTVTFRYFLPTSSKSGANRVAPLGDPPGTGSVSVTLVSTVTPAASTATIPPLSGIHEQLFLAGVGHAQGSVGLFISDLAIYPQVMRSSANFRSLAVADVDMYYTPLGGGATSKTTVASLAPPNVAAFGDFVGTVYGATGQVGSLQIRTPGFQAGEGALGVNANVFNV